MKLTPKAWTALLLLPQILLVQWIGRYPDLVEKLYSRGVFPAISVLHRYVFGWIPFSAGDLFYTVLGVCVVRFLVLRRAWVIRCPGAFFIEVFAVLSLLYLTFYLFWGLNYFRQPLYQSMSLENTYTTDELLVITEKFLVRSNELHASLTDRDSMPVSLPYSKKEVLERTYQGYELLGKHHPDFAISRQSLKRSLYSLPLTYMGYSGYLNPFTQEAQVNAKMPVYNFPSTSAHEVAHQLGYAAENEANFIGYLANIHHKDVYFRYTGYTFALRYCLNEVYRRDPEEYEDLIGRVNKGILLNFREIRDFWAGYENPLEPLFKKSFDTYLKANKQEKGIESYSYVVALLINYYKKYGF